MPQPKSVNERCSMDYVSGSFFYGRKFRVLTIVDDFSRECPAIEVDTSLSGLRMMRVLDLLAQTRWLPGVTTVDNGPEFADECLNENWFSNLQEAREIIEAWSQDYNQYRAHSSLEDLTPEESVRKIISMKNAESTEGFYLKVAR